MQMETCTHSRRETLALLGVLGCLGLPLRAADDSAPVRLAISESLVADVGLNDARAAMTMWLKRMMTDLNVVIEFSPKVFDTTEDILRRARANQLDCVALNVVEYRQIASFLDPRQVIAEGGAPGMEQYILLVKRNGAIQHLADLKGRRLVMLKGAKMCVAADWLTTILEEGRLGPAEQFLASVTAEGKASRVVLPVFFGQTDACVTSQRSFETMSELNPQVGKDLTVLAVSQPMVVTFYIFHKNYHGANRDKFTKVYSAVPTNPAGRQLATLFQFDTLEIRDISCLAPALALLDAADKARARRGAQGRKG